MFGLIAGSVTFAVAAVGGVSQLARAARLSEFAALPILGLLVGVVASPLVMLAARAFPKQRRA